MDWKRAQQDSEKSVLVPTGEEISLIEEKNLGDWWIERASNREGRRVLRAKTSKALDLRILEKTEISPEQSKKKKKARLGKRERLAKRALIQANLREIEAASCLDKVTVRILDGRVPKKLSLHSDNLKSRTHTSGCTADRPRKVTPMKKRETHGRFSKS